MADYKLTYFKIRGRVEPIRLLFTLADVKFDENGISFEEWPKVKPTTPWGSMPYLQIEGRTIAQANAIGRFLAKRFKLVGSNEFETTKCDELIDAATDLSNEQFTQAFERDLDKANQLRKKLVETSIPHFFAKFDKIQAENGGNYMVGNNITWADVWISNLLDRLDGKFGEDIKWELYPNLKKMKEHFFNLPQIKKYIDKRPPSDL